MGRNSILNTCVVLVLLAVSATPLVASLQDECGRMSSEDMHADGPDRCPGLWASCCDFGPPSSRIDGNAHQLARTPSALIGDAPTAVTAAPVVTLSPGARATWVSEAPVQQHRPSLLNRLAVLRL